MMNKADMKTLATTIKEETTANANTAARVGGLFEDIVNETNTVTIANSDKIVFGGCSYTVGTAQPANKSWTAKLANLTDYIVVNYGKSGNTLIEIVNRMRANVQEFHASIGLQDMNPTFVNIGNLGNEQSIKGSAGSYLAMFREELKLGIETVMAVGAIPILSYDIINNLSQADIQLLALAEEYGLPAYPFGATTYKMTKITGKYGDFWRGIHPGIRGQVGTVDEWLYLLKHLPKPQKSIKLFRVRDEYKSGSPTYTELAYDNTMQRLKMFYEICSGEGALTAANYDLYDKLSGVAYPYYDNRTNEYCNLLNGDAVTFADWMLAEIVIDRVHPDSITIEVDIDAEPTGIYVADNNSQAAPVTDEGVAIRVTKEVYDAFSDEAGATFTSSNDTDTPANTLTYVSKFKSFELGGYFLWFSTAAYVDSISSAAGNLVRVSPSGDNVAYAAYAGGLSYMSRDLMDVYVNQTPWSEWADVSASSDYADGKLTITLTGDIQKYLRRDKIRLLLHKASTTLSVTDISCTYTNGTPKVPELIKEWRPRTALTEINEDDAGVNTGFDDNWQTGTKKWAGDGVLADWTAIDYPTGSERYIDEYPTKHDKKHHISLGWTSADADFPQYISKSLTVTASSDWRKCVVKVIARAFPKIYDPDLEGGDTDYATTTPQITETSYDYATLCCSIATAAPYAVSRKLVDVGWSEVVFEGYIPPYVTSIAVKLFRDEMDKKLTDYPSSAFDLQVYDVSIGIAQG